MNTAFLATSLIQIHESLLKKFKMKSFIKKFSIYQARWQLSGVVMTIPMAILTAYFNQQISLLLSHAILACVFFFVDDWIFSD